MFDVYIRVAIVIAILFGTCIASTACGGYVGYAYTVCHAFAMAEAVIAAVFGVLALLFN